jgi:hypothetical protein
MRMDQTSSELAKYVLALHDGAERTRRSEDRPLYRLLLADAAVLLALAVSDPPAPGQLGAAVRQHERLRGQLYLVDAVQGESESAWELVGRLFR